MVLCPIFNSLHKVHDLGAFLIALKHQGLEKIFARSFHVDLDAAKQENFAREVCADNLQKIIASEIEHCVSSRCICIDATFLDNSIDLVHLWAKCLNDEGELRIIGVNPIVSSGCSSIFTSVVRAYSSATRNIEMVLASTTDFSYQAVFRNSYMRGKYYEYVSILRHMVAVSFETSLTDEWQTTQAAHLEAVSPKVRELSVQAIRVMINFIRAHTAREKSVFGPESQGKYSRIDLLEYIRCKICFREV